MTDDAQAQGCRGGSHFTKLGGVAENGQASSSADPLNACTLVAINNATIYLLPVL